MSILGGLGPLEIQMYADLVRLRQDMEQAKSVVKGATDSMGSAFTAMGKVAGYALGGLGFTVLVARANEAAKALFNASAEAERLRTQLNFATGGAGAREMAYVSDMARKLGLDLSSTAKAYAGFAASARGTTLAGDGARQVFEAISKASTVMGLSVEENQGVLRALSQMMSKGTVSAEELRGQLGERLPGAFQIAARAMGTTTSALGKMLEQGQLLASDFLPKFAAQLNAELGGAAESAATRLDASVNRMGNAWRRLKQTIGDAGIGQALASGARGLGGDMQAISEAMDKAGRGGGGALMRLNDGLGMLLGRAIGLQNLNRDFMTFAGAAEDARATIARLDEHERKNGPLSIYGMDERARAYRDLARAMREMAAANPSSSGSGSVRSGDTVQAQALAAEQERREALAAAEMAKYRKPEEKLAFELARLQLTLGDQFTPELRQRITDNFIKPTDDAAKAAKRAREEYANWVSARGLGDMRRQDEAEDEAERATLARIKAEQDWLSQRGLQEMKRYDEAEAAAEERWAKEVEAARKANEQILGDWQRTVDQMGQSLVDALMTGGKSIAGYLQGLFRTLVLRPLLMPTATAFSALISGTANAAGSGIGASGAGGLLNLGGALASIGSFGTAAGAGASAVLGGAGLGNVLGAGGAAMGAGVSTGSLSMAAGGAGLSVGAMIPYVAAAYAAIKLSGGLYDNGWKAGGIDGALKFVDFPTALTNALTKLGVNERWANILTGAPVMARLFGRALKDAGVQGAFSGEGEFTGKQFQFYKGGVFRSDKTTTSKLDPALDSVLDAGAAAAAATVKEYAKVLGLPVEAMQGYTQKIKLSLKGKNEQEIQQSIEKAVGKFSNGLAELYRPVLEPFQKAGERIFDTLQRLSALQTFSDQLAGLGGAFGKIAGLGFDAREGLIAMAGGMDSLLQKSTAFVQQYYNRDEIAGVKAREISSTLQGVGITEDFRSTEQLRSYLEALDLNTTKGQEQFSALLDVARDFADVAAYLKEAGGPETLREAAAQAPDSALADQLASANRDQVGAINGVALGLGSLHDTMRRIEDILKRPPQAPSPARPAVVVVRAPEVNGGGWGNYEPTGGA